MREYTFYVWLGVFLLILPFLGVPGSWKQTLTVLSALTLIVHSLIRYRQGGRQDSETVPEASGAVTEAGDHRVTVQN